jgi:ABC-type glutathione transport system ATPase component
MKETVLSVEHLTVDYPGETLRERDTYTAVQDVSFSLESGTDTSIESPCSH